jgi:hypothetical protein
MALFFFFSAVLGIETRASSLLAGLPTLELCLQPFCFYFVFVILFCLANFAWVGFELMRELPHFNASA